MISAYYFIAFTLAIINLGLLIALHPKQSNIYYTILLLMCAVSNSGYFMLSASHNIASAILAFKVAFTGGAFMMPLLFMCVVDIAKIRIHTIHKLLILMVSSVVYMLIISVGYSDVFMKNVQLVLAEGHNYMVYKPGPLFSLYAGQISFYMLFIDGALFYAMHKKKKLSYRTLFMMIVITTILGIAQQLNYFFFGHINPVPASYVALGLVFLLIIEHLDMYDLTGVVAMSLQQQEEIGHISFDAKKRFLADDRAARHMFPELDELSVDRPLPETDQTSSYLFQRLNKWLTDFDRSGCEITNLLMQGEYQYSVSVKSLTKTRYGKQKMLGYVVELEDVTSERQYMELLEKYSENLKKMADVADSANRAKSEFLSNMSHEIRTPINAILGMDEMILREEADEGITGYAEDIRSAGTSLLGIVNDILDFSKIEAGKLDIIPVEYDVQSLLYDLATMIRTRADAKGLDLIMNVNPETPYLLYGDEVRIKQVITNILTNAVKYTEKGRVVFTFDFQKKSDDLVDIFVSIKDTGIGIKPEELPKLFKAFERIDEKRNRTIEGTGLGMNITQRLLSLMGSRLEVESEYGEGSDFYFTIEQRVVKWKPIGNYEDSLRALRKQKKRYQESFTAPDAKILVVDDTEVNLQVIKGLLKKTKIQVNTATSGVQCLELVQKNQYDVVLLDHRMPNMDGIETLQHLRELTVGNCMNVPVLALTANAVSGAREMYMNAGFSDYLSKPIHPDKLEEALINFLPPEKVHLTVADEAHAEAEKEATLQQIPAWVRGIEELDLQQALELCGDPENFLNALKAYYTAIEDNAAEIERFFYDGDVDNYTIRVHALKSTSRMIGAQKLSDLAKQLEEAGNSRDMSFIHEHDAEMLSMYRTLGEKLSAFREEEPETEDESLPLLDEGTLQEALGAILEMAEACDGQGVGFVLESLKGYRIPSEHKGKIREIQKAVDGLEWKTVKSLVSE